MELHGQHTTIRERLDGSLYLIGRLTRAHHEDLAALMTRSRDGYLMRKRALDDAHEPIVLAIAARDSLDDALDDNAQGHAAALRGRAPNAARERPYTDVLPDGIDAVIASSIAETAKAYGELVDRVNRYLPEGDAVRNGLTREIPPLVQEFLAAKSGVEEATSKKAMLQTDFDAAEDELDRTFEKVAGALIERVGKKQANRCFPRKTRRSKGPNET